ncbi:hypothetical protein LguiB_012577 [Lonicera macranthoides]
MEEFFYADCKSLLVQFSYKEKQLKLKRRWLAGLPLSRDEQRQLIGQKSENDRAVPESLLREDDVYYETIKTFVEKGLRPCNALRKQVVQDDAQHFPSRNNIDTIFALLDDMTNTALCQLAEILTGGSMKFKKTRWKMKKITKEYLPKVLRNQNDNYNMNIYTQISKLLKDPQNFRRTLCTSEARSQRVAAVKILDRLEDFPTQALTAMHRRLRGIEGYVPQLQASTKRGLRRDILIQKVRESCEEMLSDLDEGDDDELQEPLTEAMTVASLTLKFILGCHTVTEFKRVAADVEFLQNEIAKAIWLLNQKGRFAGLKNLQLLLDPNAKLSNKKLQLALKRLLTESLFECSDVENIPRWLLETLAIVNKSTQSSCRTEGMQEESISKDVEEEVECVLSVSALTRQIVWDLFPDHGFDQDFADAYIEDLEESDDGDSCDEVEISKHDNRFYSYESKDQIESVGETSPTRITVSTAPRTEGKSEVKLESVEFKLESMDAAEMDYPCGSSSSCLDSKDLDSPDGKSNQHYDTKRQDVKSSDSATSNFSCGEVNFMHDVQGRIRNQYLAIQEASDETSIVVYGLIGRLLENFAHRDGMDLDKGAISYLRDSDPFSKNSRVTEEEWTSCNEDDGGLFLIRAVEELIPSFPKSGQERLKELLTSN